MNNPDPKVLVAEDSSFFRMILQDSLSVLGYTNVIIESDAKTALPLLKKSQSTDYPFDLIITDLNMPGMSGLELIKACKSDEKLKSVPIIILSGKKKDDNEDYMVAKEMGVTEYIEKPFDENDLKRAIANV